MKYVEKDKAAWEDEHETVKSKTTTTSIIPYHAPALLCVPSMRVLHTCVFTVGTWVYMYDDIILRQLVNMKVY